MMPIAGLCYRRTLASAALLEYVHAAVQKYVHTDNKVEQ